MATQRLGQTAGWEEKPLSALLLFLSFAVVSPNKICHGSYLEEAAHAANEGWMTMREEAYNRKRAMHVEKYSDLPLLSINVRFDCHMPVVQVWGYIVQ